MVTVAELKKICSDNGLKGYSKLNKEELIDLLSKKVVTKKWADSYNIDSPLEGSIYNPYYDKNVSIYGLENCGDKRQSLERFDFPSSKLFSSMTCDVLPLKDIKTIVGPIDYTEWKIGDKNIGIFGENHIIQQRDLRKMNWKNTTCFSSFLTSLVTQRSDVFFDFFYELYMSDEDKYYNRDTIFLNKGEENNNSDIAIFEIIDIEFKKCLTYNKNCPYKNLRAHYSDYRKNIVGSTTNLWYIYDELLEKYYRDMELPKDVKKSRHKIFDEYRDPKILLEYINSGIKVFLDSDKKINKQLDNNIYKKEIKEFINLKLKLTKERLGKVIEYYHGNMFHKIVNYFYYYFINNDIFDEELRNSFMDILLLMYTYIMDIYLLGRLFRTFKNKKDDKPTSMNNCIIYVGNAHSRTYNEFMESIGAKKILDIRSDDNQSLQFTDTHKKKSFLFN